MRARRTALQAAFTLTGFSSLSLQIAWQRSLAGDTPGDLTSSTTVVAAFMAGLGLGSLLGGAWADRSSPRRAVRSYALANFGVALTAVGSVWAFDGRLGGAPDFTSAVASFFFHFALLAVPATLMGFSLPLLARGVVKRSLELPTLVGRLYALNTLGAAVGAAATTWLLLPALGIEGTTWLCAGIQAGAALLVGALFRGAERGAAPSAEALAAARERSRWFWYVASIVAGAVALGLELVYFRIGEALMPGSPVAFGHVLTLYFVLYALGAAWGSSRAEHTRAAGRAFLWAQVVMGVFSVGGLVALSALAAGDLARHEVRDFFTHVGGPLIVMGVPVFLMGASFSFVLAAARGASAAAGGRVGAIQGAHIGGNVGGCLLTGFVLLEVLGTTGTVLVFAAVLGISGLLLVWLSAGPQRVLAALAVGALIVLGARMPGNAEFWAALFAPHPVLSEPVPSEAEGRSRGHAGERGVMLETTSPGQAWERSAR